MSEIGENIQREWDAEPSAGELWDALERLKQDRAAGIADLTGLAESGSALAMMYLGSEYVSSADPDQLALGEEWLAKSAEAGSIEGRLQLALHYQQRERWGDAIGELKVLAGQDYAPAMYVLGLSLWRGDSGHRSVTEALDYLKMAKRAGHLPTAGLLSWIYRKEGYGLAGRIASHWYCVAKMPALAWYLWRYPNSDRLRGMPRLQASEVTRS